MRPALLPLPLPQQRQHLNRVLFKRLQRRLRPRPRLQHCQPRSLPPQHRQLQHILVHYPGYDNALVCLLFCRLQFRL